MRRWEKAPDLSGCWNDCDIGGAVPETTEAYEDLRGMNPGVPVGMLESGTPGEPEGYELAMSPRRDSMASLNGSGTGGWLLLIYGSRNKTAQEPALGAGTSAVKRCCVVRFGVVMVDDELKAGRWAGVNVCSWPARSGYSWRRNGESENLDALSSSTRAASRPGGSCRRTCSWWKMVLEHGALSSGRRWEMEVNTSCEYEVQVRNPEYLGTSCYSV